MLRGSAAETNFGFLDLVSKRMDVLAAFCVCVRKRETCDFILIPDCDAVDRRPSCALPITRGFSLPPCMPGERFLVVPQHRIPKKAVLTQPCLV